MILIFRKSFSVLFCFKKCGGGMGGGLSQANYFRISEDEGQAEVFLQVPQVILYVMRVQNH